MLITKISPLTGATNHWEIDVTPAQYINWKCKGILIQEAMPNLSDDEREFIMSGYTPADWASMFAEDEE